MWHGEWRPDIKLMRFRSIRIVSKSCILLVAKLKYATLLQIWNAKLGCANESDTCEMWNGEWRPDINSEFFLHFARLGRKTGV